MDGKVRYDELPGDVTTAGAVADADVGGAVGAGSWCDGK